MRVPNAPQRPDANASLSRPAADDDIAANGPPAPATGEDPQGRLQALVGGAVLVAFAAA